MKKAIILTTFLFVYLFGSPVIINSYGFGKNTEELVLRSPDGNIVFTLNIKDEYPAYSVYLNKKAIIVDSKLSFNFLEYGEFGENVEITTPVFRTIDENYELVVGKNKEIRNHCNEMEVSLVKNSILPHKVKLIVRSYNDGIAFRYEFPEHSEGDSLTIIDEISTFNLTENFQTLALFLPHFRTSHEGLYSNTYLNDIPEDTLIDVPALFYSEKLYVAVTEASLVDYAGMYLKKQNGILKSELSPQIGNEGVKVKASLPHKSPWRVMLISERIGDLFESDMITNLNEPCKIEDTSWIKPGKATWPWWNGTVVSDSTIIPGNNFETNKYYIDFCARNGLEYHSVVEHGNHEWYVNNGTGYMPGTEVDVTRPVEGLDMQKVCDYAASVDVGIRVWVHWAALYPKLKEAFIQYEKWGIKGLMVDFMDRDDQEMINIQNEILQEGANHHLHIQFHGAYKPTGIHRTYPNEFTREGALNYEVNKWDNTVTPQHDLNIIFTRLLAGATDYHLGGFRAVQDSEFKVNYEKPLMMGTRCHMLAMYVILESYLGLVCDYPEAYEGQAGFDFIKKIPTVWDETKVIKAEISEYMLMARRRGAEWFLGSVTNNTGRQIEIPFDFLPEGKFIAEIYTDISVDGENPDLLEKQIIEVNAKDRISVKMADGGGMVMYLREK